MEKYTLNDVMKNIKLLRDGVEREISRALQYKSYEWQYRSISIILSKLSLLSSKQIEQQRKEIELELEIEKEKGNK